MCDNPLPSLFLLMLKLSKIWPIRVHIGQLCVTLTCCHWSSNTYRFLLQWNIPDSLYTFSAINVCSQTYESSVFKFVSGFWIKIREIPRYLAYEEMYLCFVLLCDFMFIVTIWSLFCCEVWTQCYFSKRQSWCTSTTH